MVRNASKILLLLGCLAGSVAAAPASAQDASQLADALSPRVLFVTSGGFWTAQNTGDTTGDQQRGYYRLIAIRGADNRSQLQLQQIALTADGPALKTSIGIDVINDLGAYITDIRPEDSTGAARQPGFAAYVYLKTDPAVVEPETWSIYVDEFGDMQVAASSN